MIEFKVLIPTLRNGDRKKHCFTAWQHWEGRLLDLFGGFTCAGEVTGKWTDQYSNVIFDRCRQYWIAVESNREQEVWDLIRDSAPLFDQTCIYAAITSNDAQLVY
jgi:hypothetical protein